jgi:hypothetical protein
VVPRQSRRDDATHARADGARPVARRHIVRTRAFVAAHRARIADATDVDGCRALIEGIRSTDGGC